MGCTQTLKSFSYTHFYAHFHIYDLVTVPSASNPSVEVLATTERKDRKVQRIKKAQRIRKVQWP